MKIPVPSRRVIIAVTALLATNIVTGLVTTWQVRSRDFSEMNVDCLRNWGLIAERFDHAYVDGQPNATWKKEAKVYSDYEDNARFLVHYPKLNPRSGGSVTIFCWAAAAYTYHEKGVDIPVDPAVWRAFLADGPKGLPLYWYLRENLTRAGAGRGLIRGVEVSHIYAGQPPPYKMGPLSQL